MIEDMSLEGKARRDEAYAAFEQVPKPPIPMPRKTRNGSLYVIPSWCAMSPDEHMCAWGCMGVLENLVQKNGRKHCAGCELTTEKLVRGKVVKVDGEAEFNKGWRWISLSNLFRQHYYQYRGRTYINVEKLHEGLLFYLARKWANEDTLYRDGKRRVRVCTAVDLLTNGPDEDRNAFVERLRIYTNTRVGDKST